MYTSKAKRDSHGDREIEHKPARRATDIKLYISVVNKHLYYIHLEKRTPIEPTKK